MAGMQQDSRKRRIGWLALLLLIIPPLLLGHASAAGLDVTVTASPSILTAGQSSQVQVLVKNLAGLPVPGASVTLQRSPAITTLIPDSGSTDGNGRFFATLSSSPTLSGYMQVTAYASYTTTGEFPQTLTGQGSLGVSITPPVTNTTVTPTYHVNIAPVAQFRVAFPGSSRTVTLDARASYDPDGTIISYLWDFGDGSSAAGSLVTHNYASGGQYMVTLTVYDNAGSRSIYSLSVGVAFPQPPVPVLTASPLSGTVPLTVSFSGQQSYDPDGSIALYAWNFGDGTSGQGPRTSHTYRGSGTYSVTLTVTDSQGIAATSSMVLITALPTTSTPSTAVATRVPTTAPPTTVATPTPTPTIGTGCGSRSSAGIRNPSPLLCGFLPLPVLFLFAVLAGTAIAAFAAVPATKGISQRLEQTEESVKGYLSSAASSLISRLEVTRRKLGPVSRGEAVFLGLTPKELAVLLLCAGAYTLAFLLKDRLLIRWDTFLILVGAGALTTIVHQLAHREAARRAGLSAELQFWGLGTTMLVLSAWIFGYLFASPSRNLFQKGEEPSLRTNAMISLAGPAMSLVLGIVSLLLVPLGGMAAFAGRTLFTMNLMNGVYSLVPFDPMDGKPIFDWNRSAWVAVFFPLLGIYAAVYLL